MAKVAMIERDKKRTERVAKDAAKRAELKAIIKDLSIAPDERFQAVLQLDKMSANGSKTRKRNRCGITGRPRGYFRKFKLSRIALRDLASRGELPGVTKSSW